MKTKTNHILFLLLAILIFSACGTNDESQSVFGENELPKIYLNWSVNQNAVFGDKIKFSPIVSPTNGARFKWTLNDIVISTDKDLVYNVLNAVGVYDFRFVVERNGQTTYRKAILTVTKPAN